MLAPRSAKAKHSTISENNTYKKSTGESLPVLVKSLSEDNQLRNFHSREHPEKLSRVCVVHRISFVHLGFRVPPPSDDKMDGGGGIEGPSLRKLHFGMVIAFYHLSGLARCCLGRDPEPRSRGGIGIHGHFFESHPLTHLVFEEPELGKLDLGKPELGKAGVDKIGFGCYYFPRCFNCNGFDYFFDCFDCFEREENGEVKFDLQSSGDGMHEEILNSVHALTKDHQNVVGTFCGDFISKVSLVLGGERGKIVDIL
ncbi:hypothetical protein Tco_0689000 [Tanacetum coccineum]